MRVEAAEAVEDVEAADETVEAAAKATAASVEVDNAKTQRSSKDFLKGGQWHEHTW